MSRSVSTVRHSYQVAAGLLTAVPRTEVTLARSTATRWPTIPVLRSTGPFPTVETWTWTRASGSPTDRGSGHDQRAAAVT